MTTREALETALMVERELARFRRSRPKPTREAIRNVRDLIEEAMAAGRAPRAALRDLRRLSRLYRRCGLWPSKERLRILYLTERAAKRGVQPDASGVR